MGTAERKPKYNFIKPDTIHDQVIECVNAEVIDLGYDLNNPKERRSITHNEINYILRQVYNRLFKPDKPLINNQKSLIDYDNIELLQIIADTFLDICSKFNKSLGLMSFSYMTGIDYRTIYRALNEDSNELNSSRCQVFKSIQEGHKQAQISLLNDTPVGALAVANNDHETGLEWSKNQMQVTAQSVYFLPSERVDRMRLEKPKDNNDSV